MNDENTPTVRVDVPSVPPKPVPKPVPKSFREMILSGGPWPITVLAVTGSLTFGAIALWAPADVRMALFGAHGILFSFLSWLTGSPLRGDDAS